MRPLPLCMRLDVDLDITMWVLEMYRRERPRLVAVGWISASGGWGR